MEVGAGACKMPDVKVPEEHHAQAGPADARQSSESNQHQIEDHEADT